MTDKASDAEEQNKAKAGLLKREKKGRKKRPDAEGNGLASSGQSVKHTPSPLVQQPASVTQKGGRKRQAPNAEMEAALPPKHPRDLGQIALQGAKKLKAAVPAVTKKTSGQAM